MPDKPTTKKVDLSFLPDQAEPPGVEITPATELRVPTDVEMASPEFTKLATTTPEERKRAIIAAPPLPGLDIALYPEQREKVAKTMISPYEWENLSPEEQLARAGEAYSPLNRAIVEGAVQAVAPAVIKTAGKWAMSKVAPYARRFAGKIFPAEAPLPKGPMPGRYMGELEELRQMVAKGEPGQRIPVEGATSNEWTGYGSTYPPFMSRGGYGKNETLRAIDKGMTGQKLGVREQEIWETVKEEARGIFGEKVRIAQAEKIQPIPTGELEVGDKIRVHGETLKVTERTPEQIVIKDGQEFRLDPYFDQIEGKRLTGGKEAAPSLSSLEAQVKGGPIAPLPKYAEGSSINLEKLNTTDDVKQFLNGLTKELEPTIGKKKVTWGQTRTRAEELGWDTDAVEATWRKKGSFTAAEMDAARQMNMNAISSLHEKLRTLPYDTKTYSPELRAELLDAMDLIKVTSQASSEAGRALNIHKRILSHDPEFTKVSEINRTLNLLQGKGVQRTDAILDALRTIDFTDPRAVNQFIYSVTKTPWQKLTNAGYRVWIEGLLSNPPTHIANTVSNALFFVYQFPERFLGSAIERGTAKVTGRAPERFLGESGQALFSIGKGIKDGLSAFWRSMRTGEGFGKLEFRPSPFPKTIEPFTPTRAMTAEDVFFKALVNDTELNRLAYRAAVKKGTQGVPFQNRIEQFLKNPPEQALEEAGSMANYLTFNRDGGKIMRLAMQLRDIELPPGSGIKPLGYFVPFIRTPANIAKITLERTPLNIPRIAYKAFKGEWKGGQLSEEIAKPLMGSFLAVGAYLMAKEGNLTGGLPKSKSEKAEWERIGKLPYAVKIGDRYISIARFEPLSSLLGLASDFAQIEDKATEDEKMNIAAAIAGSIAKNITNKTFTLGFARLNDAISNPEQYAEQSVESLAGSLVPAVVGGAARAIDPEVKEVKGMIDRIKSRIPGVSSTLPTQLNIWGEPIRREGTTVGNFFVPAATSTTKGTPIDFELYRLKFNAGMPSPRIGKTELTPEQYNEYVRNAGEPAKKELNQMLKQNWYQRLDDEERQAEIRKVINQYRRDAREDLIRKYRIPEK